MLFVVVTKDAPVKGETSWNPVLVSVLSQTVSSLPQRLAQVEADLGALSFETGGWEGAGHAWLYLLLISTKVGRRS